MINIINKTRSLKKKKSPKFELGKPLACSYQRQSSVSRAEALLQELPSRYKAVTYHLYRYKADKRLYNSRNHFGLSWQWKLLSPNSCLVACIKWTCSYSSTRTGRKAPKALKYQTTTAALPIQGRFFCVWSCLKFTLKIKFLSWGWLNPDELNCLVLRSARTEPMQPPGKFKRHQQCCHIPEAQAAFPWWLNDTAKTLSQSLPHLIASMGTSYATAMSATQGLQGN